MIDPKDLKWGQTPFDDLTRDEMLMMLRAYHSTVESCRSVLTMLRYSDPKSPYWGSKGTGGRAMDKAEVMMARVKEDSDYEGAENVFRRYFRYADQVLFPEIKADPEWWINSEGIMIGGPPNEHMAGFGWKDDWEIVTAEHLKPHAASDSVEGDE